MAAIAGTARGVGDTPKASGIDIKNTADEGVGVTPKASEEIFKVLYLFAGTKRRSSMANCLKRVAKGQLVKIHVKEIDALLGHDLSPPTGRAPRSSKPASALADPPPWTAPLPGPPVARAPVARPAWELVDRARPPAPSPQRGEYCRTLERFETFCVAYGTVSDGAVG